MRAVAAAQARRSPRYFGKQDPARDLADRVARAADPLHARRDRRRRLDLDDQIDGAHVDAELERGRGDDRRELAALQPVLDLLPLLARDRAVVRERDLLPRSLVQRRREPLGQAAAVDEDHRRAVRADELDQPRVDRRPDRTARGAAPRRARTGSPRLAEARHVLDRDLDRQLEGFPGSGVDDLDRARLHGPVPAADLSAAEEARDLLERALGGREADALQRAAARAQRLEPLERQKEVRAALGGGERVDLVDDDGLDRARRSRAPATSAQVERLGRRDQDVRRLRGRSRALVGGRVARADADAWARDAGRPRVPAAAAIPASGARRLRSTSTASALSGET